MKQHGYLSLFSGVAAAAFSLSINTATAIADDASASTDWFKQDYATGDWGGARTDLANKGVTPELNYLADFMANPDGGMRQGEAYAAGLTGSVTFDMEKLIGANGLSLFVAGSWQQGRDLSGDYIGNIYPVAEAFNGDVVRLNQVYLEQSLWNDVVSVAVGRLSTGDDFAALDSFGNYVSGGINGNPGSIPVNAPSFTAAPFAQWGVRATGQVGSNIYISGGAYNADPTVQEDTKNGVDFRLNPDEGVLYLAEVGTGINQGDKEPGLPGNYAIGAYYDSSDYARLDNSAITKDRNYGFYAIGEQMVYREGGAGSDQGLTAWAALTGGPDQSVNTLPFGAFGGVYYQGLFPGRDQDITAFGLFYGSFSDDLPGQSYELVAEVNHRFQLAPWLYVTPDFQYIFNPNGGGIPDAAVVGFEVSVDF
ncbi:MAG: carbohydrate porin [Pseudomonadota bacterium]